MAEGLRRRLPNTRPGRLGGDGTILCDLELRRVVTSCQIGGLTSLLPSLDSIPGICPCNSSSGRSHSIYDGYEIIIVSIV